MTDVVEYDRLVSFLKEASPFEIYRLSVALQNELDNSKTFEKINHRIKEGDVVEYFDSKTNALIKAIVLGKTQKRAIVQHINDGRRWQIPLYWLKIDSRELVFEKPARGLSKNMVKVGDLVGFYHQKINEHFTGKIQRLNPKTVTINISDKIWRVPYSLLYPIIDGQQINQNDVMMLD